MATVTGTVKEVHFVNTSFGGVGARKTYLLVCNFGAYTGSTDTAQLTGVDSTIQTVTKNGKTFTCRAAMSAQPGVDTNAQAVYTSPSITVSGGTFSFDLCGVTAELTGATASSGVALYVVGDES